MKAITAWIGQVHGMTFESMYVLVYSKHSIILALKTNKYQLCKSPRCLFWKYWLPYYFEQNATRHLQAIPHPKWVWEKCRHPAGFHYPVLLCDTLLYLYQLWLPHRQHPLTTVINASIVLAEFVPYIYYVKLKVSIKTSPKICKSESYWFF